jgi:hypothetical protein
VKEVKENILATLIYFDLFEYPLTSAEIYSFLRNKLDQSDFHLALKYLVADQSVYQFGDYYTLQNNHMLVVRRYNGNQKASELIKEAEKVSGKLIKFPYVRGIAVAGLLSKKFTEDAVIDLFIITVKNRLWVARTLIYAFKKVSYLVTGQDSFCMNYFLDEEHLAIKQKTIYTAITAVTLVPLQGDTMMEQFYVANSWTRNYLPHRIMRISSAKPAKLSVFKLICERLFNSAIGNAIDNILMKATTQRWKKNASNSDGLNTIMDAGKHHIQPDTGNFQSGLIKQYESQVSQTLIEQQNLLAN